MSNHDGFLLLLGSPKKETSTSESLGAYVLEALEKRHYRTETFNIHRSLKKEDGRETLIDAVSRANRHPGSPALCGQPALPGDQEYGNSGGTQNQ